MAGDGLTVQREILDQETGRAAEAQAGAAAEQAKQLAEVTEEVLEELKEMKEGTATA